MSRVAKKPIALPKGVEFNIQSDNVSVKGPKGTLSIAKPNGIEVKVEDGNAQLSANDDNLVPLAGTLRAILANMRTKLGASFYFGGTSLLIVVVVVMDFIAQIQAHLMSHQYESLLKKANLKGGSRGR